MSFATEYLLTCKKYYHDGVIPAISVQARDQQYYEIKKISEMIIKERGINSFADFLYESQYFVRLWTAHLIIEEFNISDELKNKSLLVIKSFIGNPLAPKASEPEELWLKKFYPNT